MTFHTGGPDALSGPSLLTTKSTDKRGRQYEQTESGVNQKTLRKW